MSTLPRSVLAAVDFGDASARAVALGGYLAERSDATLRLVHAESSEAPVYFTAEQLESLEKQRQATRSQAEHYLTAFGRRLTHRPFTTLVDDRTPVDAILHESAEADLVVMGTHGRHGPKRWWLGSVAERVLRGVRRPLLIVRAETPGEPSTAFGRLLVHAAAPLVGEGALQYARELAGRLGSAVEDRRHEPVEPAIARTAATLLVVAAPIPRPAAWLANYGEPLIRFCTVPILFVPETSKDSRQ